MVRTQVQLEDETYEEVRRLAFSQRTSISALMRKMINEGLGRRGRRKRLDVALLAGIGKSGKKDISSRHDDYLAEDFKR